MGADGASGGYDEAGHQRPLDTIFGQVRVDRVQQIFRLGWIGPYPAPDAFLTPLFSSGRTDNVTGFESDEVDELLAAGRSEPDEARRLATYQEAEKRILERLPIIPLAQFEFHSLVSGRVTGLAVSGLGTFDATKVQVAG